MRALRDVHARLRHRIKGGLSVSRVVVRAGLRSDRRQRARPPAKLYETCRHRVQDTRREDDRLGLSHRAGDRARRIQFELRPPRDDGLAKMHRRGRDRSGATVCGRRRRGPVRWRRRPRKCPARAGHRDLRMDSLDSSSKFRSGHRALASTSPPRLCPCKHPADPCAPRVGRARSTAYTSRSLAPSSLVAKLEFGALRVSTASAGRRSRASIASPLHLSQPRSVTARHAEAKLEFGASSSSVSFTMAVICTSSGARARARGGERSIRRSGRRHDVGRRGVPVPSLAKVLEAARVTFAGAGAPASRGRLRWRSSRDRSRRGNARALLEV